jgi:hypothetical protein
LVEKAAEIVGNSQDLVRFAGGDVDHERFLELRLETAIDALDGETGKQGPDPGADTGVFQWPESVAAVRGTYEEREMADAPWIKDAAGRIVQRFKSAGFAIHEVDAADAEMKNDLLPVSSADLNRGGFIAWESPARLRMRLVGGKTYDAEGSVAKVFKLRAESCVGSAIVAASGVLVTGVVSRDHPEVGGLAIRDVFKISFLVFGFEL